MAAGLDLPAERAEAGRADEYFSWGSDSLLYVTGHDHPELYALRLPKMGSILEQVATYPIKGKGQGIAWDRSDPGVLWMISRQNKEAIAQRMAK